MQSVSEVFVKGRFLQSVIKLTMRAMFLMGGRTGSVLLHTANFK